MINASKRTQAKEAIDQAQWALHRAQAAYREVLTEDNAPYDHVLAAIDEARSLVGHAQMLLTAVDLV